MRYCNYLDLGLIRADLTNYHNADADRTNQKQHEKLQEEQKNVELTNLVN